MGSELLGAVRAANHDFERFIDQGSRGGAKIGASRGVIPSFDEINQRLQQVGQCLTARSVSAETDQEDAQQLAKYRENLKRLRSALENLQSSLLAEKARLEQMRANMQAACFWAASLREIS